MQHYIRSSYTARHIERMCVTAHTHTHTHTLTNTGEGNARGKKYEAAHPTWWLGVGVTIGGHGCALGVREAVVAAKRRMVGEIFMSRKRGEASLKTAPTLPPHPSNPLTQSLLLSRVLTEPIVTSLRDILLLL